MMKKQDHCLRCGTCCNNGGPALHIQDLLLLQKGKIPLSALITLRFGEMAHNPLTDRVQPISCELVKISGSGKEWCCCYFDPDGKGCMLYNDRPYACRVLKCWQPEETLALIEKDTLSRFDILKSDDPLRELVKEYEKQCPCPHVQEVVNDLELKKEKCLALLEDQVREDLRFRQSAARKNNLDLSMELFLFGRPIFQLFTPFGVRVREQGGRISLY